MLLYAISIYGINIALTAFRLPEIPEGTDAKHLRPVFLDRFGKEIAVRYDFPDESSDEDE